MINIDNRLLGITNVLSEKNVFFWKQHVLHRSKLQFTVKMCLTARKKYW